MLLVVFRDEVGIVLAHIVCNYWYEKLVLVILLLIVAMVVGKLLLFSISVLHYR